MRIIGHIEAAFLLGFGLAAASMDSAFAQTVIVGDQRPQIEVDAEVLDQLGPPPTLPDLLLGQQPKAPPGAPVKLHRPRLHAPAAAKPPAGSPVAQSAEPVKPVKPLEAAQAAKPLKSPKAVKVAQAELPPPPKPAASTKALVSSLEPRPPNAAMPNATVAAGSAQTPPSVQAANQPVATQAATPTAGMAQTPPPTAPAAQAASQTPAAPAANQAPAAPAGQLTVAEAAPAPGKQLVTAGEAGSTLPPAKTQQALITPPPAAAAASVASGALSIPFAKDAAELTDTARGALTAVAARAVADQQIQLQVLAYASGDEENASKARRLSLSRALAVRSFLIDQGVHSTRIEVRALGNKVPEGPADRVDLVEEKR